MFAKNMPHRTIGQLVRYGLSGSAISIAGYSIYYFATFAGAPPKLTMTACYVLGLIAGYFLHGQYSFSAKYLDGVSKYKYVIAHVFAYLTNLLLLFYFSDQLGYPHELVQFIAIFVVAGQLFLSYKLYVFSVQS